MPITMEDPTSSTPRTILSLPPKILVGIFNSLTCRTSIKALALTHPTLQKIYNNNSSKIYASLIRKLYGPVALSLIQLSKPNALRLTTREYLYGNTAALTSGCLGQLFSILSTVPGFKQKEQSQFWTIGEFFIVRKEGSEESVMNWLGFGKAWMIIHMDLWRQYIAIFPAKSSPVKWLESWEKPEDPPKPGCQSCLSNSPDGACEWHKQGSADSAWLETFNEYNESGTAVQHIGGTIVMFDAYLRYLYLFARCSTPFPASEPKEFKNWKCSVGKNCIKCASYKKKIVPRGGFHFIDYSSTETLTGAEWIALRHLEKRMAKKENTRPFKEFVRFTAYWGELFVFSGVKNDLRSEIGSLPGLKKLKEMYFSDENRDGRSFDLKEIEMEGKKEVVVVNRKKWEELCGFKKGFVKFHDFLKK